MEHIKFEMLTRHPNGDVLDNWLDKTGVLGRVPSWKYKCGSHQQKRRGPRTET